MANIFDRRTRQGDQGRIPDSKSAEHELYSKISISLDPETVARVDKFCEEEERARSWVIRKALDEWLTAKGY